MNKLTEAEFEQLINISPKKYRGFLNKNKSLIQYSKHEDKAVLLIKILPTQIIELNQLQMLGNLLQPVLKVEEVFITIQGIL